MRDFRFTNELQVRELGDVVGLLQQPRLWIPQDDYPDYYYWLEKAEAELGSNTKRAMLAYAGRDPVGTVLYQKHKESYGTIEIKNISVSPDMRGRYVGAFLLRNMEIEALNHEFPGCTRVTADTKATNSGMIGFLLRQGYTAESITDLYGLGAGEDIIFTKSQGV